LDISSRIPPREQILAVYAVIVLMVYTWTIQWFNYNLPAWLGFLTAGEVLGIFAYAMANNFLESLLALAAILAFGAVLPRSLFRDAFVARGAGLAALTLGFMMYAARQFSTKEYYPAELVRWTPAILAAILVLVFLLGRVKYLRLPVEFIADRAIIFLYISIPVSVVCVIAVLIRNLP
jgi:hypothetical protein